MCVLASRCVGFFFFFKRSSCAAVGVTVIRARKEKGQARDVPGEITSDRHCVIEVLACRGHNDDDERFRGVEH